MGLNVICYDYKLKLMQKNRNFTGKLKYLCPIIGYCIRSNRLCLKFCDFKIEQLKNEETERYFFLHDYEHCIAVDFWN